MSNEAILVERTDSVVTISMNRPARKNALTHAMYDAFASALQESDGDDSVRVIVIRGEGGAFTSGNDLGDFIQPGAAQKMEPVLRFLDTLLTLKKPLLAAVEGPAIGVGLTMLLHCDLVFASDNAIFGAPFTKLGLVPEAGSSMLLSRRVGGAWAGDILLAGRTLNAEEALSCGLISRVLPVESLAATAAEVAAHMATLAPNSMLTSKALMKGDTNDLRVHMNKEAKLFAKQLASSEFRESVMAIKEKRAPRFEKAVT
ncbi:MAG: enoyl-CoA hydratase/carnithine racemase [Polyangiales bacterium]|jgi:enoyl-CoA hydratase/carnithine racemase